MANQTAKQLDVLGFDRMEIANVRRCYAANKTNYTKLHKLYEKVMALKGQIDAVKDLISAWDAPVHQLTKNKLGVELTSEEVLIAHTNPEEFFKAHPELKPEQTCESNEEVPCDEASYDGALAPAGVAVESGEAGPEF